MVNKHKLKQKSSPEGRNSYRTLKGIPASPGISIGKAFFYESERYFIEEKSIKPEQVESEILRLRNALDKVSTVMKNLQEEIRQRLTEEHASILTAPIMFLEDPDAIKETEDRIRNELKNAEFALFRTIRKMIKAFQKIDDPYLKERINDINDLAHRVFAELLGESPISRKALPINSVIVTSDISPPDMARLPLGSKSLGLVTEYGGATSHAAILARALEIPAVIGVPNATNEIEPGVTLIIDGLQGTIHIDPPQDVINQYREEKRFLKKLREDLRTLKDFPAVTRDGINIPLLANIEFDTESTHAISYDAKGIGLYRTEFLYLLRAELPDEEIQYKSYHKVAKKLAPLPVTIRTLDVGGDKLSHSVKYEVERNPFLGRRAIRFCLDQPQIFKTQLRAILRASTVGNVKLMFPMISSLEELLRAKEILEEVKDELRKEKIYFDENMQVGIMIEIPSAVMVADQLAPEADFFSIGTNDLIQYSIAVDRANERIADLYDPYHPGVLRLIRMTVEMGHEAGIPVSLCGEMSGDAAFTQFLLGIGIDELSINPADIPNIKRVIRATDLSEARKFTRKVLKLGSGIEIRQLLNEQRQNLILEA